MGLSTIVRTPQFIKDRASGRKVTDYRVSATIEAIKPGGAAAAASESDADESAT